MGSTIALDQMYPGAAIVLELGKPVGVEPIPDFADDRLGLHCSSTLEKTRGE